MDELLNLRVLQALVYTSRGSQDMIAVDLGFFANHKYNRLPDPHDSDNCKRAPLFMLAAPEGTGADWVRTNLRVEPKVFT